MIRYMAKAKRFLVAVYDCDKRFGGREEGGWWYDSGSLTRVVRVFRSEGHAFDFCRRLNLRLQSRTIGPNQGRREYTSVLSDGEYQASVWEDTCPNGFPDTKPRYQ